MSAEPYQRQLLWKEFISTRSGEQGRATPDHLKGHGGIRTQPPSRSSDKATSTRMSKGRDQHRSTPAPSYSSMLATRRTEAASAESLRPKSGSALLPARGESVEIANLRPLEAPNGSSSRVSARARAASITRGRRACRQADGNNSGATLTSTGAASNGAPRTRAAGSGATTQANITQEASAVTTAQRAGEEVAPHTKAGPARAAGGGRGGGEGEGDHFSEPSVGNDAVEKTGASGRWVAHGKSNRQIEARVQPSDGAPSIGPTSRGRNRRAFGSVTASGSAVIAAVSAAVPEVDESCEYSDDGGAGNRWKAAVASSSSPPSTTSAAAVAERTCAAHRTELARKEQAWIRERAQLLTVIKLQQIQLTRAPEVNGSSASTSTSASSSSSSSSSLCEDGNPFSKRGSVTGATVATTAANQPASPGSARRNRTSPLLWPPPPPPPLRPLASQNESSAPESNDLPSPLTPPPPPPPPSEAVSGSMPPTSLLQRKVDGDPAAEAAAEAVAAAAVPGRSRSVVGMDRAQRDSDQPIVFSTSERTHLLSKIQLQREEAVRASQLSGRRKKSRGRSRMREGAAELVRAVATPAAAAVEATTARRSSATSGDTRTSSCGSGGGGGGCSDPCKGEHAAAAAAGLVEVCSSCASSRNGVEGRLEVMERSIALLLRRVNDLDKKASKGQKKEN